MNSETEDGNKSMELLIEEETKETNRDKSQSQRINEFINDLKEAIESGKLHQTNMLQQSAAQLNKLINVDNLSNQTFTYIINWLKQQQEKKTNLNFTNKEEEELYGHHSDINLASDVAEELDKGVVVVELVDESGDSGEMDLATEIKFLRNKIKASELDKDKMMAKINELQKENLDLKTKLLMRPGQQSYSLPLDDATQNEINNLKILVQELIKSNDEKDKKLDELTKQVIRFKRIQEIVLSAQAPIKSKNYDDLSFEMNPPSTTSQSAAATAATTTTTTMTEIHMTHSSYATAPNGVMTTQLDDNQHTSSSSSAGSSNKADQQQQPQDAAQQKQTGASNADPTSQIISSCSLTSSISSSSSSASSSSSTSSASSDSSINSAQHHHQSPATTTTTSNNAPLTAPLATITEFINYSSSSTLATPNPSLTCSQHNNNRQHNLSSDTLTNVDALNTMSMSTANTRQQQQTEPSKQQQKSIEGTKTISNPIKEKLLFEAAFGKSSKSISKSASNKAAKYSSAVSLSATSSPNQNDYANSKKNSALNSFKLTLSPNKSNNTSTNHHSSNRSLRNFFGKLIRTSLVNINESTFGGQHNSNNNNNNKHEGNSQTLDNKAVSLQQQLQVQMPTSPKTPSSSSNPFKRGGLRSTANARLQNAYTYGGSRHHHHHHGNNNNETTSSSVIAVPSHVDMLTFAKWPSAHVCEWLARHGFDAYFPVNTESGQRVNKFIKNGLQLLQATQYDYERELGIKNPLHRKKLGIILQGLYSTLSPDPNNCQTIEQINLTQLDQHWVTKWLDDIGLPQYKDTFNEHMIDGRMLHHLSQEDFATLSINSELHYLSIKWAIHVLRLNNFDPHCLRRRPSGDEALDRAECSLWTNHRCMEWLRSIDLSEYAPNLRGSGVHGGLLVFEARFNPQCLADILSIPASKTLLRRHLSTLFSDLIGPEMCKLKRDAQSQSGYVQLTAQSKVKHVKPKSSGHHHHSHHQHGGSGLLFTNALGGTHKRTKSQDSRDFLGLPMALVDKLNQQQLQHQQHQQMMIARASSKTMNVGQSATLPLGSSSIYSDNIEEVSNKSTTIKYVR